jgi:phosphoribosylformimino-5-aminoimidazole carboxamide ribotide isomerase
MATEFARQGAEWIHVVDLDAAFGEGSNRPAVIELARSGAARIQSGGGLRSEADLESLLEGGIERAIIGTAAIEHPEMVASAVRRWGADRIAVGLDARGRKPAVRGWREDSAEDLLDIATRLTAVGVRIFIYTDISRDGMFTGPNVATAAELADHTGADVIVSGGVGSMDDLDIVRGAAAAHPGIAGVIVGKAIYEGRIDVADALERLRD